MHFLSLCTRPVEAHSVQFASWPCQVDIPLKYFLLGVDYRHLVPRVGLQQSFGLDCIGVLGLPSLVALRRRHVAGFSIGFLPQQWMVLLGHQLRWTDSLRLLLGELVCLLPLSAVVPFCGGHEQHALVKLTQKR